MDRSQEKIKDYFKEYIFGFIFNDIENCIKAKANYTVALALLSYTEFLGGLISGTLGLRDKNRERFNSALNFFDFEGNTKYYKEFKVKFRDVDYLEKDGDIYTLFRCGLAHEYFIKSDSLVHNNSDGYKDELGINHCDGCLQSDAGVQFVGDKLRFHNNAYFRDLKKACKKYYEKLIEEKNINLLKNFNNALDRIEIRRIRN